jgi:uncharacterized protein
MRLAVLADTHIPKRRKALSERAWTLLRAADCIIHAGDVVSQEFLEQLSSVAPLYAVLGNNDHGLDLPERLNLEFESVRIGVVHDSGDKKGRAGRLRKWFPDADVVVFGHSHIPINETENGMLLFDPGSATERRRQPKHTMGMLNISDGVCESKIIELD